jgi:hypothetical protein
MPAREFGTAERRARNAALLPARLPAAAHRAAPSRPRPDVPRPAPAADSIASRSRLRRGRVRQRADVGAARWARGRSRAGGRPEFEHEASLAAHCRGRSVSRAMGGRMNSGRTEARLLAPTPLRPAAGLARGEPPAIRPHPGKLWSRTGRKYTCRCGMRYSGYLGLREAPPGSPIPHGTVFASRLQGRPLARVKTQPGDSEC